MGFLAVPLDQYLLRFVGNALEIVNVTNSSKKVVFYRFTLSYAIPYPSEMLIQKLKGIMWYSREPRLAKFTLEFY